MGIGAKVVPGSVDPQAILGAMEQKMDAAVSKALTRGLNASKRHLIAMVSTRLTRRSGALSQAVQGMVPVIHNEGNTIQGDLELTTAGKNARGQSVTSYIWTQLGKGVTRITGKARSYLAIPIQGGPAYPGNVPLNTPATFWGLLVRIKQVLYADIGGGGRNMPPTFALIHNVTVPTRVSPQDAVDEAQAEILAGFGGTFLKDLVE